MMVCATALTARCRGEQAPKMTEVTRTILWIMAGRTSQFRELPPVTVVTRRSRAPGIERE